MIIYLFDSNKVRRFYNIRNSFIVEREIKKRDVKVKDYLNIHLLPFILYVNEQFLSGDKIGQG